MTTTGARQGPVQEQVNSSSQDDVQEGHHTPTIHRMNDFVSNIQTLQPVTRHDANVDLPQLPQDANIVRRRIDKRSHAECPECPRIILTQNVHNSLELQTIIA